MHPGLGSNSFLYTDMGLPPSGTVSIESLSAKRTPLKINMPSPTKSHFQFVEPIKEGFRPWRGGKRRENFKTKNKYSVVLIVVIIMVGFISYITSVVPISLSLRTWGGYFRQKLGFLKGGSNIQYDDDFEF